ncbi:hypothetical protein MTO96_048526 [Rhipicephalus appendiculatus]
MTSSATSSHEISLGACARILRDIAYELFEQEMSDRLLCLQNQAAAWRADGKAITTLSKKGNVAVDRGRLSGDDASAVFDAALLFLLLLSSLVGTLEHTTADIRKNERHS